MSKLKAGSFFKHFGLAWPMIVKCQAQNSMLLFGLAFNFMTLAQRIVVKFVAFFHTF